MSEKPFDITDYVLESEHIIFIGDPATYLAGNISPENFKNWLNKLDSIYKIYLGLVGRAPGGGAKVKITVDTVNKYGWAWYWPGTNDIGWHADYVAKEMSVIESTGTVGFGMLHEIGHLFDGAEGIGDVWSFHPEFTANLKILYAMETDNSIQIIHDEIKRSGSYYRNLWHNNAAAFYNDGNLKEKISENNDNLQFYFSPIVDNAGWKIFKSAFHSYFDNSYPLDKTYSGSPEAIKLAGFLDRLTYFNHGVDVLSYSLDNGEILRTVYPDIQ